MITAVDQDGPRTRTTRNRTAPPFQRGGSASASAEPFTAASRLLLVIFTVLLCMRPAAAAPVDVRYTEGVGHAFLLLRTLDGVQIASGELLQVVRRGAVENRMTFSFKDGSLLDETVVFTQDGEFAMRSYGLVQRGPAFTEDTAISLDRISGEYSVTTTSHDDGSEETLSGTLELPADVYNGMMLTVAKNLPKETGATVHMVAFTPEPVLMELEIELGEDHDVLVGDLVKSATHFLLKPRPGAWIEFFARLLGRMPSDYHAWVLTDAAPAFVKFEGPLDPKGPVWQIELTSPRWPD
jgi:hypothetical protein